MKSNLTWVDYAKGIGIILVVYGHVARGLFNANLNFSGIEYELIDSIVYSFHMPLFFFLSGLFFYSSLKRRGGSGLIFNKVDTILYPYIIWSIFQGSIEVLLSNFTNSKANLGEVFSLLVTPRAQFWYLYILFIIFAILAVIFSAYRKRDALLIGLLFSTGVLLYLIPEDPANPLIYKLTCKNLVYFSFGILISRSDLAKRILDSTPLIFSILTFIVAQWIFHDCLALRFDNRGIESLLLALVSILFIASLSVHLSKIGLSCLAYLGSCSLAIYLMHILVGSCTRIILLKLFDVHSVSYHLLAGVFLGVYIPCFAISIFRRIGITYAFSAPISKPLNTIYLNLHKNRPD